MRYRFWTMKQKTLGVLVAMLVVTAACNRGSGSEETSTTFSPTVPPATQTTEAEASPSEEPGGDDENGGAGGGEDGTTTTVVVEGMPGYEIRHRSSGDTGDRLVVLLEPGSYSDVQLDNVIRDVVEEFRPVDTAHIVDDAAAVPVVLKDDSERTEEEEALLEEHYLLRLEEGSRVTYLGPFSDLGSSVIGS